MTFSRRDFLLALAPLAAVPAVARRLHGAALGALDPALVRALGETVLPSELGPTGIERVVSAFERWLAGYREGAELLHPYGSGEIHHLGPSPALRWAAQARDLDTAARRTHRTGFAALPRPERTELVRRSASEVPEQMPTPDQARHLALGVMAFFYASPEATDLCYRARIGRNLCRPLDQAPDRPLPLAREG